MLENSLKEEQPPSTFTYNEATDYRSSLPSDIPLDLDDNPTRLSDAPGADPTAAQGRLRWTKIHCPYENHVKNKLATVLLFPLPSFIGYGSKCTLPFEGHVGVRDTRW
ncbi:hypothetical protein EK21DRAFT_119723 [Setomelanomma holmii]|uniref:Uncharacterized protein n=1 Tax=Setomelanomma holmii TaxID=210430 RepID=A0A9P4GVY8_9PLEO|nr:hypothetical protein EK21DRAFT_119723 [Setomelanomma holmii]